MRFFRKMPSIFLVILISIFSFANTDRVYASLESDCKKIADSKENAHDRLWKLFQVTWDDQMKESPEWASDLGYPGQSDKLADLSFAAIDRRKKNIAFPLQTLARIDRNKLSPADQENYDLFQYNFNLEKEGSEFPEELLAISQLGGVQQNFPDMLVGMPKTSPKDFEDRIARLKLAPKMIDQTIELLRKGIKEGVVPPKITLRDVPDQIRALEEPSPKLNPLLTSFQGQPKFMNDASVVVTDDVIPAFHRLHEFMVNEYLPKCRDSIAWESLPNGKAWYAYQVKSETTANLNAEELHALGLKEVARIRAEMDKLTQALKFKGDFAQFSTFLRTDPRFFFTEAKDLLSAYRDIDKRIDPELPKLFGKLPRLTYGVLPVPAYSEKSQTTGYYYPGSPKTGRAGIFYANTYDLKTRPKWEMEALSLHESVPGHHLQISLAQELGDLPEFRKNAGYGAYSEGWALYAESLGEEIGIYTDPYSKFGQLTYEMWRAIRLVVDTGMHSKGWTRDQAIDYFKSNSSKSAHDITVEIDRYIVWAGQALAYKSGELRIKALRAEAKAELGEKFDLRKFHDEVLAHGAVPLDTLDKNVKGWIRAQKSI